MCNQVKKCDECGKESEGVMTCEFPSDGSTTELCPICLKEDGSFCLSCGQFCSGMQSFDFIHPGYCDTCWDEISEMDDWDDEENEFYPCSKCDGHPACEDHGCAIELGLGKMVKKNIEPGLDDWG